MKKLAALAVCSLSLGVMGISFAAPMTKMSAKKPVQMAGVTCPACKKMGMNMPMTSMKTKVNTRAVKVNGKTMYCCKMCKMTKMTIAKKAPMKKM